MDLTAAAPAPAPQASGTVVPTAAAASAACLYECQVMHRRLSPKVHQFNYNIFLFCLDLDLDLLGQTARTVRFFSHNRWNLYNFRDRDHLTFPGLEAAPLKENLLAWIHAQPDAPILTPDPRVVLITLPRVLGYVFNPVSFYFLSDRQTERPLCAVVQVGNTFREMKPWLLHPAMGSPSSADPSDTATAITYRRTAPKMFYVSPFSALDLHFDFKLKVPGEKLEIHINTIEGKEGPAVLLSTLTGIRRPLANGPLLWLTIKFPFITLKVILLIHWQAFRLWLRKIPFHRKAENLHLQQGLVGRNIKPRPDPDPPP